MEPADSEVRVEIQEKLSDAKKDHYVKKLKRLIGGGVKSTKTQSFNGKVTIVVGPVSDVEAFAEKITFARVVEVKAAERTIILSIRNI
ncbi:MAG: hypothetical protein R3236_05420 [Phycisphaeraceae bacterium]|nr:hypothetical protein [Phycisphaeraceae bacterium]